VRDVKDLLIKGIVRPAGPLGWGTAETWQEYKRTSVAAVADGNNILPERRIATEERREAEQAILENKNKSAKTKRSNRYTNPMRVREAQLRLNQVPFSTCEGYGRRTSKSLGGWAVI
jgi:hypothetical protein